MGRIINKHVFLFMIFVTNFPQLISSVFHNYIRRNTITSDMFCNSNSYYFRNITTDEPQLTVEAPLVIKCAFQNPIQWDVIFEPKLQVTKGFLPYQVMSEYKQYPLDEAVEHSKSYFEIKLEFSLRDMEQNFKQIEIRCASICNPKTSIAVWRINNTIRGSLNLTQGEMRNDLQLVAPYSRSKEFCKELEMSSDTLHTSYGCFNKNSSGYGGRIVKYLNCSDWSNCQQLVAHKFENICQGSWNLSYCDNREQGTCQSVMPPSIESGIIYCNEYSSDSGAVFCYTHFFKLLHPVLPGQIHEIMVNNSADRVPVQLIHVKHECTYVANGEATTTTNDKNCQPKNFVFQCSVSKAMAIKNFDWSVFLYSDEGNDVPEATFCNITYFDGPTMYKEEIACKFPHVDEDMWKEEGRIQFVFEVTCTVYLQSGQAIQSLIGSEEYLHIFPAAATPFEVFFLLGAGMVACLLILCPILMCSYRKNRILTNAIRDLTEKEEHEFLFGKENPVASDYHYIIFSRAFDKKYELFTDELKIDDTVLGSGQYGVVKQGHLRRRNTPNNDEIRVAVKTVKEKVETQYFLALLSEVKIMAYLEEHENIVNFIGAWIESIKTRQMYVAVEFCSKGDLLGVLRRMKSNCSNNDETEFEEKLMLYKWARDIASGLSYISSKKVIHGDLAARNILISATDVAKISDYGLSRIVQETSSVYSKKTRTPLPWKWMAPESLESLSFTLKSDVWSFGVTLWEIFSLGNQPYPGTECNQEFVQKLMRGYKLSRPTHADQRDYEVIESCWEILPQQRPDIPVIRDKIEEIVIQMTSHLYHNPLESEGINRPTSHDSLLQNLPINLNT